MGLDMLFVIATDYGLDGPRIGSRRGGGRFSATVQTGSEAHPPSYSMGTGSLLRGGKAVEA
jgi:hypothetical protein